MKRINKIEVFNKVSSKNGLEYYEVIIFLGNTICKTNIKKFRMFYKAKYNRWTYWNKYSNKEVISMTIDPSNVIIDYRGSNYSLDFNNDGFNDSSQPQYIYKF